MDVLLGQDIFKDLRHEAVVAVGAVVGADVQFMGRVPHPVFQDQQVLGTGADNADHVVAGLFEGPGDGMQDRHPGAAPHADHLADLFDVGGFAQGTDNVLVSVAHLQGFEQCRGFTHDHVDDGDGPLFGIGFRHGQRYAFAVLVGLQNHELTRFGFAGDRGCFDFIQHDRAFRHFFPFDYCEHICLHFFWAAPVRVLSWAAPEGPSNMLFKGDDISAWRTYWQP